MNSIQFLNAWAKNPKDPSEKRTENNSKVFKTTIFSFEGIHDFYQITIKTNKYSQIFSRILSERGVFLNLYQEEENAISIEKVKIDEQLEEVARFVQAYPFIGKLEDGFNYKVVERGATFSGGQRQLIAFARTIAANPKSSFWMRQRPILIPKQRRRFKQHWLKCGKGGQPLRLPTGSPRFRIQI